jgi:hypothetical protein
LEKE